MKQQLKRIAALVFFLSFFALLIVGYLFRNRLNSHISTMMQNQITTTETDQISKQLNERFNYDENNQAFELSFLEFGAKGCLMCRKMEQVMKDIENQHPEVNVVFVSILKPENQNFVKYYGISFIPTQILLDKNGKEFFRNEGYMATEDLIKELFHKSAR